MVITGTHHIALRTDNFLGLRAFYRDTLGLPEIGAFDGANIVFLRAGDAVIELVEGAPAAPAGGFAHWAFQVDDITETAAALEQSGITLHVPVKPIPSADAPVAWIAFFRDPDGNELELFQPVGDRYPQGKAKVDSMHGGVPASMPPER